MKIAKLIEAINDKRNGDKKFEEVRSQEGFNGADLHYAAQYKTIITLCRSPYGIMGRNDTLIVLDDEDIDYFERKYSKLLEKERQEEINKINEKYKAFFNKK